MRIRHIVFCFIAGITLSLVIACSKVEKQPIMDILHGGDDEPILVGGGSLHLRAHNGQWIGTGESPRKWEHCDSGGNPSKRFSTKVDIVYVKGATPSAEVPALEIRKIDQHASIEISFSTGEPPVTLEAAQAGGLTVTSNGPGAVGANDPSLISFPAGTPKEVVLKRDGQADERYSCGSMGRCILIIHYCYKQGLCR
jgi:hypothetical protein